MKQVRFGIFETNSSSTHSLCICTRQDYLDWQSGLKLYDNYNDELYDKSAIDKKDIEEEPYRYKDYEYTKDPYLDYYEQLFTTPSGDEMVAFGWYGYDG